MSKSNDLKNTTLSEAREPQRAESESRGLKLGLIGDNIAASQAPLLHCLAGELANLLVTYDRLVPRELGMEVSEILEFCEAAGYRGVNVTYPYKEIAAARVRVEDPMVREVGAVNTVIFGPEGRSGYNTDYSGFLAAYRAARGRQPAGRVCLLGAGGVGRAIAFALLALGLEELTLLDLDHSKAEALSAQLRRSAPDLGVKVARGEAALADICDGFVNCTPVGMVGYEGTPLSRAKMKGGRWAFDAVYTPIETEFLKDAEAEGLEIISGYELFFHQGVDAWRIFSQGKVDPQGLRRRLAQSRDAEEA